MQLRCCITVVMLVAFLGQSGLAQATVYVSSSGSDTNPGTVDLPFKTIAKGLTAIGSNGTVLVRGGVYVLGTSKLSLSKTGTAANPIRLWAYTGETAIFDCMGNTSDGVSISGSYYHLKGIEVRNAGHNGINISGNNNTIENCSVYDNGNTGLHLTVSGTGVGPSYNLILNCDAFGNYDTGADGGNADGFSAKWSIGSGNVFRGCRAFNNSDDGWDLWMATSLVVIENCWAFRNGNHSGNGNGFKLGGSNVATPNTVRNCVSFDNAGNTGRGFDENNNLAGQTLFNCTAYRNKGDNYHFSNTVISGQHVIKNCISYSGNVAITSGILAKNSWQGFTVTNSDFVSLDTSMATAPRDADGSLPASFFLHLALGSSMIDAGDNVGLPFSGKAPDLGAFETGTVTGSQSGEELPLEFTLGQNFPNPFNPATIIRYCLPFAGYVSLKIFDTLGREVAVLVATVESPGEHRVNFDAHTLPSGTYIARLTSQTQTKTIKLVLMK